MGIFNFIKKKIARSPVVIRTTRSIAKQYLKIKSESSDKDDNEIFKEIINWIPDPKNHRQALINTLPEIKNLTLLIYWILVFETELGHIVGDLNQKVIGTIRKELEQYNLK